MANLIPSDRKYEEFNGSIGEFELYEKFKSLPDDYIIFHSASWTKKEKQGVRFGEADYAIYHPNYGLLCLEVKHGGISGEEGRVYQENTRTGERFLIQPMEQAQRSQFLFLELINKELKKMGEEVKVYSMVWFTLANKKNLLGEFPLNYILSGNTFFREDMNNVEETILKCFKHYGVKKRESSSRVNKTVMRVLSPKFQVFPSMAVLFDQNELSFNQMTREQSYLLDYLEEQKEAAIQGGAGSGKTMLALEKARRLSEEEEVLFLCFNTLLVESLKQKYANEMPNVTFSNIDKLLTKKFKRLLTNEEKQEVFENYEEYNDIFSNKNIIIDEGQDFSDIQIKMLKETAYIYEKSFYVFYDRNQLVQQKSELKWLNDMDCQLVLSFNCRNTKEIAETSAKPIHIDNVKMRDAVSSPLRPLYHNVRDAEELKEWIDYRVSFYINEGVNPSSIVILTTKTIEKSLLSFQNKLNGFDLTDTFTDNSILFTTSRKFKGLESDVIMLIDIDLETFSNMEQRRVFYVGASRAKNRLELISTLLKDEEKEFYQLISEGEYKRNSAVLEYLKADLI